MNASEIWVITNRSNQAAMRLYETTGARSPQSDDVVFIYDLDSEWLNSFIQRQKVEERAAWERGTVRVSYILTGIASNKTARAVLFIFARAAKARRA